MAEQSQQSLQALKLALKTEEEGYELYKNGAANTRSEMVRAIFQQLFKDELMHMDLIKRFYARLSESGSWSEMSEEERNYKGLKGELNTIFSAALDKVKSGDEEISDSDMTLYKRAIQFENDGVKLYDRLYNETEDAKAKKFYIFLREMEQDHADVLDDTFQYLKDPTHWFMGKEGWTLDH
ncbi:MAG: ferritin family protein [Calditrichia bacterium]